jgi:GMP synthase-like glutamine amidotransferase
MRVGDNAWSMQYHVEVEEDTVDNWSKVPAYRDALMNTLGEQGLNTMNADADKNMASFLSYAESIYRNFMKSI